MLCGAAVVLALALPSTGEAATPFSTTFSVPFGLFEQPSAVAATTAESSGASVTVGLEVRRRNAESPIFALRGRRPNPGNGRFAVGASAGRTPCPGEYRFEAAQENTGNGNSATYSALIRLLDPEADPPHADCGEASPPRPGTLHISVATRHGTLLRLHAERKGGGIFRGTLAFLSFLECDRSYRLRTELDLSGWDRSTDFRLRVLAVNVAVQGRELPGGRC